MKKHSVTIAGHRTSLSLEDAFWNELKRIAEARGVTLNNLITQIDKERDLTVNLCSALRLYVLEAIKSERNVL